MAAKKISDKQAAKEAAAAAEAKDLRPRLSRHPRAQRQIREAKAWAGIVGFVLVGLLSVSSNQPLFDAGLRALVAGIGCYMVGWALAVIVWRHLARAEVEIAGQRIEAEQAAAQ